MFQRFETSIFTFKHLLVFHTNVPTLHLHFECFFRRQGESAGDEQKQEQEQHFFFESLVLYFRFLFLYFLFFINIKINDFLVTNPLEYQEYQLRRLQHFEQYLHRELTIRRAEVYAVHECLIVLILNYPFHLKPQTTVTETSQSL